MSVIVQEDNNTNDLLIRFPPNKYTIFKMYYHVISEENKKIRMLSNEELVKIKSLCSKHNKDIEIKCVVVVTKKFTWSVKNELMRTSQKFSNRTLKKEIDFDCYISNIVNNLLILIIEDHKEYYIDESLKKRLNKDFINSFIEQFFLYNHFDVMSDEEEHELRIAIHDYYSYWIKANSNNQIDQMLLMGKDPPLCPSIVIESGLAEKYGWQFDYIRSLDERDIKSLFVLQSQKEISDFEASDEAKNFSHFGNKKFQTNLPYHMAQKMALEQIEKEKKEKEEKEQKAVENVEVKEDKTEKQEKVKVLSKAEQHVQKLRNVNKI